MIRIKYIGKVDMVSEGITYEPGIEYMVKDKLAEHPFFQRVEEVKATVTKPSRKRVAKPRED